MNVESIVSDCSSPCRLCAQTDGGLIDIYSEEGSALDILDKIKQYVPIEISQTDELSTKCCTDCVSKILSWHKFILHIKETSIILKVKAEESRKLSKGGQEEILLQTPASLYAFCPKVFDKIAENYTSEEREVVNKENPQGNGGYTSEIDESESANIRDEVSNSKDAKIKKEIEVYSDLNIRDIEADEEITESGNEGITESANDDDDENGREDTYKCHFCPEIFSSEVEVLNHTNENHQDVTDTDKSEKKAKYKSKIRTKLDKELINEAKVVVDDRVYYNCKQCGKSLLSPYTYIWHMRIHTGERPFVCDLCGKQFRVSQGLVRHLKETHERIKNFPCDLCGRMFATKRNVEEHRHIHTNERPYICALCGKAFKQKASLFVHNRIHSDTFPYKCEYCNQGFRAKPPLLIHLTKHTGQKPYPCEVCGRCFRIKYELKRHKIIHSEERPFVCTSCGMCFKQKRYLTNHIRSIHSSDTYMSLCC